jgi:hypothetical protein
MCDQSVRDSARDNKEYSGGTMENNYYAGMAQRTSRAVRPLSKRIDRVIKLSVSFESSIPPIEFGNLIRFDCGPSKGGRTFFRPNQSPLN